MARFRTPSLSRKTAARTRLEPTGPGVLQDRLQRLPQSGASVVPARPTEAPDAVRLQSNDRDVALPPATAARVLELDARELEAGSRKFGDFRHGDVVAGRDVEGIESL